MKMKAMDRQKFENLMVVGGKEKQGLHNPELSDHRFRFNRPLMPGGYPSTFCECFGISGRIDRNTYPPRI
jgi:hypothetical protein